MRSLLLTCILPLISLASIGQIANETISLNPNYTNQVFYSLEDGEAANVASTNWDLQFGLDAFSVSIRPNGGEGAQLFMPQNSDTSAWANLDTTGMVEVYNSDTSWEISAFNAGATGHPDYGWGTYQGGGTLIGKQIFVLKLVDGSYLKVWVEALEAGITYRIKFANLDGSGEFTESISKMDYSSKSFVYYSVSTQMIHDIEPIASNWDLVFRRYLSEVAPGTYYALTGALSNLGVTVAEQWNVNVDDASYVGLDFQTNISAVGGDWKNFNMNTFSWELDDSVAYFVKNRKGDIYKLYFTDFGGQANGNIAFNTEKVFTAPLTNINEINLTDNRLHITPNPASLHEASILVDKVSPSTATLTIRSLDGKMLLTKQMKTGQQLVEMRLDSLNLISGTYLISIHSAEGRVSKKLVII